MSDDLFGILDEDDELLVVDKPAGLVCHPSKDGPLSSLIGRVRLYLRHGEGRLINRLDRETSGIVMVAKHRLVAADLGRLFARDEAAKSYLAVVHGDAGSGERLIDAPLGKDERSPVAIKDCVRSDGAPATTCIRSLGRVPSDQGIRSLVEARPRSGRKHQIRIHLAHVGLPIVGDKLYGDDERRYLRFVGGALTAADRVSLDVPNHALHAERLAIPWRGAIREWQAPAPRMIQDLVAGRSCARAWQEPR